MINEYEIKLSFKEIFSALVYAFKSKDKKKELENRFASLFNKKALGVGSGSDAIFVILKDIKKEIGVGEVICSNYSCKSIPRSIIKAGFDPVFVDLDETFSLDINLVKKAVSEKTKAILIYHPWGFPHSKEIFEYCKHKKIYCIEDCAKGLGYYKDGGKLGSLGDYSFFSFRTGKLLHAGSGSIILSKKDIKIKLKDYPKLLSTVNLMDLLLRKIINLTKPKAIFDYLFDKIGQIRLGEAEAYLVLKKVKFIEEIGRKRRRNYEMIVRKSKVKEIFFNKSKIVPLSLPILVSEREKFVRKLKKKGIKARIYYTHINSKKFQGYKKFLNGSSERISKEIVNIPVHEDLNSSELVKIVEGIKNADKKIN